MRRAFAPALLLVLAVVLVNLPALDHPFFHDDLSTIVLNPAVRRAEVSLDLFTRPESFSPHAAMYRPLLVLSYALNARGGGLEPFGFRLVNLGLHLAVCLLAFWLARLLPPLRPWSFWIALLFGLHPVHAETLNYISCRSALGASAFGLLAVVAALKFLAHDRRRMGWLALSLLCFALALGFKAIAFMVPAQVFLLDFLFLRRGWPRGYWDAAFGGVRRPLLLFAGMAFIAVAYLVLRHALALETFSFQQPARPVAVNLLTQMRALALYLRLLCWPVNLALEHQVPILSSIREPAFIFSALLMMVLLTVSLFRLRRDPTPALAMGWFLLCLAPTSSLVPLNVVAAENRLYPAALAGVWFLVWLAGTDQQRSKTRRGLLAGVALFFASLTLLRHPVWRDGLSLWRDAVHKAPGIARNHINFGIELRDRGRPEQAAAQYRWALNLEPNDARAYSNLANAYSDLGRHEDERAALEKALHLDPSNAVAQRNLGHLLAELGRGDEAIAALENAARLAPRRADLHYDLGVLYLQAGRLEAGQTELEESLRLNPDQPQVRAALEDLRRALPRTQPEK